MSDRPSFQARHFRELALALQELRRYADGNHATAAQTAQQAVKLIGDMAARSNNRFERDRFEAATVPGANVHAGAAS
jgi:hypothetical protein